MVGAEYMSILEKEREIEHFARASCGFRDITSSGTHASVSTCHDPSHAPSIPERTKQPEKR